MATVVKPKKARTVNPLKLSQPVGGALAFMGVRGAMPLLHGSQGCTSFGLVLFVRHFRPLVEAGHVYVAMPPLYRIDLGKEVYYALDEGERDGILERLEAEKKRGKPQVTRFKGLGEMNPLQLRETTMDPNTRRLVQLSLDDRVGTEEMMDMLLAKKRSGDRKTWLESKGDLAEVLM